LYQKGKAKQVGLMRRFARLLGSAAAVLTLAMSAQPGFADGILPSFALSMPPPVVNWTGFYLGGEAGAVFTDARYTRPNSGLQETTIGTIDGKPALGIYGGFNYQALPWLVLGVEGNMNWLKTAKYIELGSQFDFLQEANWVGSVTGRVGVLAEPRTMLYAKAGPAWVNLAGVEGFGTTFQRTKNAVQAGVGIESFVTQNIAVRGEVTYTYVDQLSLNTGFDLYRPVLLMAELGLAYKFDAPFGWGSPAAHFDPLPAVASAPLVFKGPAPPPADAWLRWTGFEAGGFVSANGNQVTFLDAIGGFGFAPAQQGPYADFRVGGGFFFGANLQLYGVVLGIEGSENFERARFNTAAGTGGVTSFSQFARINGVNAITGRVGLLVTPDTLFYAKGGPAAINFGTISNFWNAIAPNATSTQNLSGYIAGFGVESFVLPHVSLRVEALYAHTDTKVVLNGVVPNEFTLQPSVLSATFGAALHL
jgi:outer membrane immunogenic protein